ncbi:MAG: hypothetical protein HY541_09105 [Deltaproteobacteria bacterium]|nr:hypothetical protein [Deltaproteobacteria bacterium]
MPLPKRILFLILFVGFFLTTSFGIAAESNIYSDAERGFSLEVPAGWEVLPQKSGDLAVVLKKPTPLKPFDASVVVTLLDQTLPMPSNGKELKLIVEQISGPSASIPNIENYRIVSSKLDDRKGDSAFFYQASYELTRVGQAKDRKVKTLNYIFRDKGRCFAFSLVTQASEYKKMEKTLYQVIDSVQVGEPAPKSGSKKMLNR